MTELHIMDDLVPAAPQFKTGVGDGDGEESSNRRSFGSSLPSPETEEFESLEKSFREELQQKLQERKVSEAERKTSDLATGRRLSGLSSKTRKEQKIFDIKRWITIIICSSTALDWCPDLMIFAVRKTLSLYSWWRRDNCGVSPERTSTSTPWRRTWPSGSTCSTPTSTSTPRTSWTVCRQGNIYWGWVQPLPLYYTVLSVHKIATIYLSESSTFLHQFHPKDAILEHYLARATISLVAQKV